MFSVFAQAYANQGDLWENLRADQCKPKTECRFFTGAFTLKLLAALDEGLRFPLFSITWFQSR